MTSKEGAWRKFVEQYDIEVPESSVENELQYLTLEMKHRMQYDTLVNGNHHLFAQKELDEQADEMRQAAYFEAKADLVMKAIIAEQGFTVSQEELEAEAAAMAERQNATVDMIKTFFGNDLTMLARDVKERKAIDWVYEQSGH